MNSEVKILLEYPLCYDPEAVFIPTTLIEDLDADKINLEEFGLLNAIFLKERNRKVVVSEVIRPNGKYSVEKQTSILKSLIQKGYIEEVSNV